MDFEYIYTKNYAKTRAKDLSSDEKAFLVGWTEAVRKVKRALGTFEYKLDENEVIAAVESKAVKQFLPHLELFFTFRIL